MKMVPCWNDMRLFGIDPLTGEACGLSWRILFDLDERGANVVRKCFGLRRDSLLGEAWNRGTAAHPHVGSVMLTQDMLKPLAVFALLENGCREVYIGDSVVFGIEDGDPPDTATTVRRL